MRTLLLSRQGQTPLSLTKANQKWASGGSVRLSRRLSPGRISRRGLGEHDAVVGNDRVESDIVDSGGQQFGRRMAQEFQRQLEVGFDQPVGQAGGGGGQILLQRARNALPFGRLQGGRQPRPPPPPGAGPIARSAKPRCKFTSAAWMPRKVVSAACAGSGV